MAPLTADAARVVFPVLSEGFAALALGYRSAAPMGRSLVGSPFEYIAEKIFKTDNKAKVLRLERFSIA